MVSIGEVIEYQGEEYEIGEVPFPFGWAEGYSHRFCANGKGDAGAWDGPRVLITWDFQELAEDPDLALEPEERDLYPDDLPWMEEKYILSVDSIST